MLQTLLDSCAALGVPLTAAQAEQLCDFGARLLEQNRVMNLTAITEPQAVAKLHFADCLALLRIVPFSGKRVIDVGCGAGFPGVPLKLGEPSLDLTLLDSLGKRVTWLEATLRDWASRRSASAPVRRTMPPRRASNMTSRRPARWHG